MSEEEIAVDEEVPVDGRDLLRKLRTDICDTEIAIDAMETYDVKSQRGVLEFLKGRLKHLKQQFHIIKTLTD